MEACTAATSAGILIGGGNYFQARERICHKGNLNRQGGIIDTMVTTAWEKPYQEYTFASKDLAKDLKRSNLEHHH